MTEYKRGTITKDGKIYGFYPDGSLYRIYEHTRPFITFHDIGGETVMRVREATELGYAECRVNQCCDLSYPESTLRRSRVIGGGIVNALTSSGQQLNVLVEI